MSRICFWVPGLPVGVPRPRARHVPGGPDGRGFTRIYTPVKEGAYKDWLQRVNLYASLGVNRPPQPLDGPLSLLVFALFPRPRSLCRRGDPPGVIWAPTSRSDWDNVGKVSDVFSRINYWHDDRQVCDGRVLKGFHAIDYQPGALFVIEALDMSPPDDLVMLLSRSDTSRRG